MWQGEGERVGYRHPSLVVVEPALVWPRYGLFPGRSVAAVGGRAVVVVCGVRKERQHYRVGKLMSEVEMTWHNFADRSQAV